MTAQPPSFALSTSPPTLSSPADPATLTPVADPQPSVLPTAPTTTTTSTAGSTLRHNRGHSRTSSISMSQRNSTVLLPPLSPAPPTKRFSSRGDKHRRTHSRSDSRVLSFSSKPSNNRTSRIDHTRRQSTKLNDVALLFGGAPSGVNNWMDFEDGRSSVALPPVQLQQAQRRSARPPSARVSRTIPASAASLFGPSPNSPRISVPPVLSTSRTTDYRDGNPTTTTTTTTNSHRNSRHLRHASVSTKRDSLEIMQQNRPSVFYSPADRRRSARLSGTWSASMLFGQPPASSSNLASGWTWNAKDDDDEDYADESRVTALEKLEGKRASVAATPAAPAPAASTVAVKHAQAQAETCHQSGSHSSISSPTTYVTVEGDQGLSQRDSRHLVHANDQSSSLHDSYPLGGDSNFDPPSDASDDVADLSELSNVSTLTASTTAPDLGNLPEEGLSTLLEEEEEEDTSFPAHESKEVAEHQRTLRRKSLVPAPLKLGSSRPLSKRFSSSFARGLPSSSSLPLDLADAVANVPTPESTDQMVDDPKQGYGTDDKDKEEQVPTPRPKRLSLLSQSTSDSGLKELRLAGPSSSPAPAGEDSTTIPKVQRRRSSIMYKNDSGTMVSSRRGSLVPRRTGSGSSLSSILLDELRGKAAQDAQALETARQQLAMTKLELAETRSELDAAWAQVHDQSEHFKSVELHLLARIEELSRAQTESHTAVAHADRRVKELSEQLEMTEAERDTYKDDVDGWRERCAELERRATTESERAETEATARLGLVTKVERLQGQVRGLGAEVATEDQLSSEDLVRTTGSLGVAKHERTHSSSAPAAPPAEATVKLLAEMRQQIFNLARTLEHERNERTQVDETLTQTRTALSDAQAQLATYYPPQEDDPHENGVPGVSIAEASTDSIKQVEQAEQEAQGVDESMDDAFALDCLGAPEIMVQPAHRGRTPRKQRHVFAYDSSNDSYSPPSTVATSANDGSVSLLSDRRSLEDVWAKAHQPTPTAETATNHHEAGSGPVAEVEHEQVIPPVQEQEQEQDDDLGLGNSHHTHASIAAGCLESKRNTLHTLPEADEEVASATVPTPTVETHCASLGPPEKSYYEDPEASFGMDDLDPEAGWYDEEGHDGTEGTNDVLAPRELFGGRSATPDLYNSTEDEYMHGGVCQTSVGSTDETPTPEPNCYALDLGVGYDGWETEPESDHDGDFAREFDRSWSFAQASSKAQQRIERQTCLVAQAHGGKVPTNFIPGPKIEGHDFFGINTELDLPPLSSALPSDLPPIPLEGLLRTTHARPASRRVSRPRNQVVSRSSLLGMTSSALNGLSAYFLTRPTSVVGAAAHAAAQAAHSCGGGTQAERGRRHAPLESQAQSFSSAYSNAVEPSARLQALIEQQGHNPTLQHTMAPPLPALITSSSSSPSEPTESINPSEPPFQTPILPSSVSPTVTASEPFHSVSAQPKRLVPRNFATNPPTLVGAARDTLDFVPATEVDGAWPVFYI